MDGETIMQYLIRHRIRYSEIQYSRKSTGQCVLSAYNDELPRTTPLGIIELTVFGKASGSLPANRPIPVTN